MDYGVRLSAAGGCRDLWKPERGSRVFAMFNMNNKKKNQRISIIIVVLLVLAMVVPLVTSMFY